MWIVARWRTLRERPSGSRSVGRRPNLHMKRRTASERKRHLEHHYGAVHFHCRFGNEILRSLYWAFRRLHYFLCFYDNDVEVDLEDLLTNPFNTQPPSLEDLQKLTGFRKDWIMFLYRNFKQISSNGRMSQSQWRQIFRLLFKGATDYEFADRLFGAIIGARTHRMITFEDLIVLLFDLTQSFKNDPNLMEQSVPSTTKAQFTFNLMLPDKQGRVDSTAFLCYAKCVFDLNTSLKGCSGDAATFGVLGGSTHGSQHTERSTLKRDVIQPWTEKMVIQQFKMLDKDNDGFITISDVQRLFEENIDLYESIVLKTEDEIAREKAEEQLSYKSAT